LNQRFIFVYTRPDLLPERVSARQDDYWPNPGHRFDAETPDQIKWLDQLSEELNFTPMIIDNSGSEPQILANAKLAELK